MSLSALRRPFFEEEVSCNEAAPSGGISRDTRKESVRRLTEARHEESPRLQAHYSSIPESQPQRNSVLGFFEKK